MQKCIHQTLDGSEKGELIRSSSSIYLVSIACGKTHLYASVLIACAIWTAVSMKVRDVFPARALVPRVNILFKVPLPYLALKQSSYTPEKR